MLMTPWPTMPPESSLSVGMRSMPPMVVEEGRRWSVPH